MLPTDPKTRKQAPVYTGFMKYFPRAIFAIANLSYVANEQHNPGTETHWDKTKSKDNLDAQMRHVLDQALEEGGKDTDEILHLTKNAWRALAALEIYLENEELKAKSLDGCRPHETPDQRWLALTLAKFTNVGFEVIPVPYGWEVESGCLPKLHFYDFEVFGHVEYVVSDALTAAGWPLKGSPPGPPHVIDLENMYDPS
jgi:hypothetical protein